MPVPAQKYGKENTIPFEGLLNVMDQFTVGDPAVTRTATSASGAVTLNVPLGSITTESVTTAGGGAYVLTVTNSCVAAGDLIFATVTNGTNSGGVPGVSNTKGLAGSAVITISNDTAATAFNGTLVISFMIVKF